MNKTTLKAWFFLFRPWSYLATVVPFLVAASMLRFEGNILYWLLGIVSGLFFQATVNLLNTWGDERSGVDAVPGAIRTTPQIHEGLVSMNALFVAAAVCAIIASLTGVALCFYVNGGTWHFNKLLFGAGVIGCLGSLNYSTGIKFKYRGLGVPFVSFLMGPLEIFVAMSLLNPALHMQGFFNPASLAAFFFVTLPVASLVGIIMHGNDMRDIPTDRAAGIVTLASALGAKGALTYYWVCHLIPYVVCVAMAGYAVVTSPQSVCRCVFFALPFLCLPLTIATLRAATSVYKSSAANPPWRGLERGSGRIHLVFGTLYAIALLGGCL